METGTSEIVGKISGASRKIIGRGHGPEAARQLNGTTVIWRPQFIDNNLVFVLFGVNTKQI